MKRGIMIAAATIALQAQEPYRMVMIVPGTWSLDGTWYRPGGDFFQALEQDCKTTNTVLGWCAWVSGYSSEHREQGARELAYCLSNLPANTHIQIIAHSHGGNVTLRACQLLAQQKACPTIDAVYLLGVPINEEVYPITQSIISHVYNGYSLGDVVQTLMGDKRTFKPRPEVTNMRLFVDDQEPMHTHLHTATVGAWILHLNNLMCPAQSTVHFYHNKHPEITPFIGQDHVLALERPLLQTTATLMLDRRPSVEHKVPHAHVLQVHLRLPESCSASNFHLQPQADCSDNRGTP